MRTGNPYEVCGKRRSSAEEEQARTRLEADERLAAALRVIGINPYRNERPVYAVDLATKGEKSEYKGQQFLHRRFFQTVAAQEDRQIIHLVQAYFEQEDAPGSIFLAITLRPKEGKLCVQQYAEGHRAHAMEVAKACREIKRRNIGDLIICTRSPRPIANGWVLDLHSQLVIRVQPEHLDAVSSLLIPQFYINYDDIEVLTEPLKHIRYLLRPKHWELTGQAASYDTARVQAATMKTSGPYLDPSGLMFPDFDTTGFDPDALKLFWKQTKGLRWVEVLGSLRRFRTRIPKEHRLTQTAEGEVIAVAKATRPRWRGGTRFQEGPVLLAIRPAYIAGELRPALLVRGWTESWQALAERYDLDTYVDYAREVMANQSALDIISNPPNREYENNLINSNSQPISKKPLRWHRLQRGSFKDAPDRQPSSGADYGDQGTFDLLSLDEEPTEGSQTKLGLHEFEYDDVPF